MCVKNSPRFFLRFAGETERVIAFRRSGVRLSIVGIEEGVSDLALGVVGVIGEWKKTVHVYLKV